LQVLQIRFAAAQKKAQAEQEKKETHIENRSGMVSALQK